MRIRDARLTKRNSFGTNSPKNAMFSLVGAYYKVNRNQFTLQSFKRNNQNDGKNYIQIKWRRSKQLANKTLNAILI